MNRTIESLKAEQNFLIPTLNTIAEDLEAHPEDESLQDTFLALTDRSRELMDEIDRMFYREMATKRNAPSWRNLLGK